MNNNLKSRFGLRAIAFALGMLASSSASAFMDMDLVYVADSGNPSDALTGYGAVGYGYGIGKYEVTLNQYTTFLNAVAAVDSYALYNVNMAANATIAGILRSGASGSYTYSVIGSGDRPVTYVSWFDAARFVNWMHNGQPTGTQNAGTTEDGAYTLNGALSGNSFTKNSGAQVWIPSENEWYKAAYYQPAGQGGDSDGYWLYPTGSNTQPNSRNGSLTDPNSANFYSDDEAPNGVNDGYAVTGSTDFPAVNALTGVGAFSLAGSYYGTFDQGGNVEEWNDAIKSVGNLRGIRGGSWFWDEGPMKAIQQHRNDGGEFPQFEFFDLGFRIAAVPEPRAAMLLLMGILTVFARRSKRL